MVPGVPESKRPGALCNHCGTPIVECFYFRSADGKEFHVGNVCVVKSGDRGLIDIVKQVAGKAEREKRAAKAVETLAWLRTKLQEPAVRELLAAEEHPYAAADREKLARSEFRAGFFATKTRLDWAEWMVANAGARGRGEVARYLGTKVVTR